MGPRRRGPALPWQRVTAKLRERLEAGEWLPGEALPSVRALAAEYGVSPPTISRAVRALANDGLVTGGAGLGDVRRRAVRLLSPSR